MDRARTYGYAAVGGILVVAALILAIGRRSEGDVGDVGPPEAIPRGLALTLLVAVPAIVAAIGVRRRDRVLVIAAGLATLPAAVLSVATIALILPALLSFVAGASMAAPSKRSRWLLLPVIVALQAGAIWALLGTTEGGCWVAYESGGGGLIYRAASEAETHGLMGGPGLPVAGGCGGGALTERGAALAGILVIGALAIAFAAPGPPAMERPRG